jgi:hypothetical protein
MNIKFYAPKEEVIPTRLRLMVDGKQVDYKRVDNEFAYDFQFYDTEVNECFEIAREISKIMCSQSNDHGARWVVTDISLVEQEERYSVGVIVRVDFRIRDSY